MEGALSCFEDALVAFGGKRPKLEDGIAELKKKIAAAPQVSAHAICRCYDV